MNSTAIDPTSITATVPTRANSYDHEPIVAAWWAAAEAAGLTRADADTGAFNYDEHMSIDSVTVNGRSLYDLDHDHNGVHCGEVFGLDGTFYAIVLDQDTARAIPLDINDPCDNCGGEIDLAARPGCTNHHADTDEN